MNRPPRPNIRRGLVLLLVIVAIGAAWFHLRRKNSERPLPRAEVLTNALQTLTDFEARAVQEYWQPELIAEQYGHLIEKFWDQLNSSSNKLEIASTFPAKDFLFGGYSTPRKLPHGIEVFDPSGVGETLSSNAWREFVQRKASDGWELTQCEFRHNAFHPGRSSPSSSAFYFSAHLVNRMLDTRAILEGDLSVIWEGSPDQPAVSRIAAKNLQIRTRRGPAPFKEILSEAIKPPDGSYLIDPLIVWDLDHDGTPEIILAAKNLVYRRQRDATWLGSPLCGVDPGIIFTGILGDFNGDGATDFLIANFEGLFLYEGTPDGKFPAPPRQVWAAQPHLKYAQTLAVGDVDADGDLDIFLGQYKVPYFNGQLPFPYFDANDANPSFLFLNDGHGNFTDATSQAGLGAKRGRRVYSAALVDLDSDGDLDLVLVSDFAGLDAYANDGHGHFSDITEQQFGDTHGFGMGLSFADFNHDGSLDILMIGMNSPTADRLASLRLNRPYDLPDDDMRRRVTYGNRLFFGTSDGRFRQKSLSHVVARTGWSWGSAAADLDNDGFPDLYIVNGHESRRSVTDYEPEFWLHDIYIGKSRENSLAQMYFQKKFQALRGGQGQSYGGYEKNRLFLNLEGTNFVEVAHLFGLALEDDCRNVIADDLNGDGKLDLILTTFSVYPNVQQSLRIFENQLPDAGSSIDLELRDDKAVGRAFLITNSTPQATAIISGDAYRSQSRNRVHIGLGPHKQVAYDSNSLKQP
ncbi:MAG TPA: VCBS repeat-containing protein [Verrucomicrobiae bacterium]|jgi:hypothetical protein|nr:VCBS repeat-containing protein [Verrucomicrobiae bacterium]